MEEWTQIVKIAESIPDDARQFLSGNKAAGTRFRKKLLEIKKKADQLAKDVIFMIERIQDAEDELQFDVVNYD